VVVGVQRGDDSESESESEDGGEDAAAARAKRKARRKAAKPQISPLALSTDHKVNLKEEQARIEAAGGWVRPPVSDPAEGIFMPARFYSDQEEQWRGPGLCVSRAIGDLTAGDSGLISTPDIFSHEVNDNDLFVILASDGVWEFIESEEAVKIVYDFYQKGAPALDAVRYLIAKAAVCWRRYEGDYRDDITAVVVYLQATTSLLVNEVCFATATLNTG
jgi:serine/threonine protein phosphatase PrpC